MNECTLYALCMELTESHFWVVKWYILSYESPPLTAFPLSTRGARMKWFGHVAIGEMAEWAARLAHGQGWCISGPLPVVSSLGMVLCIPLFIPQPTSQNFPNFLSILNLCCLSESSSTQDSSLLPFKGTFLKILPDKWGAETYPWNQSFWSGRKVIQHPPKTDRHLLMNSSGSVLDLLASCVTC